MFCGNTVCIDGSGAITSRQKGWRPTVSRLAVEGYIISSQATFWRREIAGVENQLDPKFDHAMDMDIWLRVLWHGTAAFTRRYLGAFRIHPGTKTSVNGHVGTGEFEAIVRRYGYDPTTTRYKLRRKFLRMLRLASHYAHVSGHG